MARKEIAIIIGVLLLVLASPAWARKPHKKEAQPGGTEKTICYELRPHGPSGRCEPQSLPYARCRSGLDSCRAGRELSPMGWYHCEASNHHVADKPSPGCVLILGDNSKHHMNTGHVFFVENCRLLEDGRQELTLSHTNHDRRCSMETEVLGDYDEKSKTLTMKTGAWKVWGKDLKALGFIVK